MSYESVPQGAPLINNFVGAGQGTVPRDPQGSLPEGSKLDQDSGTHWRDPFWACLFYLHLGVIALLALYPGIKAVNSDALSINSTQSTEAYDLNADIVIRAVVLATVTGTITSLVMLYILQRLGGALIRASFLFSIVTKLLCGVIFIAVGQVFPGAVLIVMGLFVAVYYSCIRSRVRFAAAHVEIATLALKGAPDLIFLNVVLLFSQGIWSLFWALAAVGVEASINNGGNPNLQTGDNAPNNGVGGTVAIFFLLLSYFWVSGVIHNLAAFCSSSVVGDWWWKGDTEKAPVRGALYRAFTSSFGTISMGAFLVAFCQALTAVKKMWENKQKSSDGKVNPAVLVLYVAVSCVLCIVQSILEWANQWAIVIAALTGLAFKPAGLAAVELFKRRGWGALINQDLVGTALRLASLVSASIGALAGGLLTYQLDSNPNTVNKNTHVAMGAILSFFVAMLMASVLTSIVQTGTKAVFVAWAQDPGALAATHPLQLRELAVAWHECHPGLLEEAGYARALSSTLPPTAPPPGSSTSGGATYGSGVYHATAPPPPPPTTYAYQNPTV